MKTNNNITKNEIGDTLPTRSLAVNDHQAVYFSVMGAHTPGVNSDAFFVNTPEENDQMTAPYPRLLSVVCDGVTGRDITREKRGGQFAAEYFSQTIPQYWEKNQDIIFPAFSDVNFLQQDQQLSKPIDLVGWLLKNMQQTTLSVKQWSLKEIISQYSGHLLSEKIPAINDCRGLSADSIAKKIFRKPNEFESIVRLLFSIHEAIKDMEGPFLDRYLDHAIYPRRLESMSTITGVIDLIDQYMVFGIGDSRTFVVDEEGFKSEYTTERMSIGHRLMSTIGCYFEDNTVLPVHPKLNDGISIRFVKKQDLTGQRALVSLTDGLAKDDQEINSVADELHKNINNIHEAAKSILDSALGKDKKTSPRRGDVSDDKTMVVLLSNEMGM